MIPPGSQSPATLTLRGFLQSRFAILRGLISHLAISRMKKFIAIYGAPVGTYDEMMKNPDPAKQKEGMDAWTAWIDKHKASFVMGVNTPVGKNKRVTASGIEDKRNEINGVTIVEAEDHDAAAKIFTDNPELKTPGAYVDVLTWVEMPGM